MAAVTETTAGSIDLSTISQIVNTMNATTSIVNSTLETATATDMASTTAGMTLPTNPAWLRSAYAQGIAGAFVWAAIIITCHQVSSFL